MCLGSLAGIYFQHRWDLFTVIYSATLHTMSQHGESVCGAHTNLKNMKIWMLIMAGK